LGWDVKENMQRRFRMDYTAKEHSPKVGSREHKNEIPAIKRQGDLDWFTTLKFYNTSLFHVADQL
jgi:hypothetical protein